MATSAKIAILGDSISAGFNVPAGKSYPDLLKACPFIGRLDNVSLAGTTIGRSGLWYYRPLNFIHRSALLPKDSDLVFVFGGTNDYGSCLDQGEPLGELGDTKDSTFYGALFCLEKKLRLRCPQALLVFATPLSRDNQRWGYPLGEANQFGSFLVDYRDAILLWGKKAGIAVVDLFALAGYQKSDGSLLKVSEDGLHPNELGHALLAAFLAPKLKALLVANGKIEA